jgi:hypothetical protein
MCSCYLQHIHNLQYSASGKCVFLYRYHHLPHMDCIALLLHQIPVQKMHI